LIDLGDEEEEVYDPESQNFKINFYQLIHKCEGKTYFEMERDQGSDLKTNTLFIVGVSDYNFLCSKRLHKIYSEVIVLDHHESLWNYLEDEDL